MKDAKGHGSDSRGGSAAAHQVGVTKLGRILAKRHADEAKAKVELGKSVEGLRQNPQGSAGYPKAYDNYRRWMTAVQSFR